MDFGEREGRCIYGYDFKATDEEQRDILRRVRAHPKFKRWSFIDYAVKNCTDFKVGDLDAQSMVSELVELDLAMGEVARLMIEELVAKQT